ncbi:MAG: hypothetical protein K8S98_01790, partial [Planctomycetes bacterium]|nr:hypothetical protein [Planctomycetota bacterium]
MTRGGRVPIALLGACAVYLALRAAILWTNFDAVAIPRFELGTTGNLAAVTAAGTRAAPLVDFYDNCGGHLVTGLLAAPLFRVFGGTYAVLKLVPLLLGLVALLEIWWILNRWWSRGAANVAAWCFALPPPTLLKYSLLAKGNHFENLPFQLAVLALFLGVHTARRRNLHLFVLGIASGFAVFFYFGALLLLALCGGAHVAIVGVRRAAADVLRIVPGFLLGIAPLVWIEVESHGRPQEFLEAKFEAAPRTIDTFVERTTQLATDLLPRAGVFEDFGPVPGRVAERVFLASFLAAWLALTWSLFKTRPPFERWKHAGFWLHLPLFFVAFGVSTFDFDVYFPPVQVGQFRYLVPHFAFATMLFGVVVASAWNAGGWRRFAGACLGVAVLGTGLFGLGIVDLRGGRNDAIAKYPGSFFHYYADVVLEQDFTAPPKRVAWRSDRVGANVVGLAPAALHMTYEGVGFRLAQTEAGADRAWFDEAAFERLLAPYDKKCRIDLARGVGTCLRTLVDGNDGTRQELARDLELLASSANPFATYVVEGLCIDFRFRLQSSAAEDRTRIRALEPLVPASLRSAWLRGQGLAWGRHLRRGIETDIAVALARGGELLPADRSAFWFGVGWGLADGSDELEPPAAAFAWA